MSVTNSPFLKGLSFFENLAKFNDNACHEEFYVQARSYIGRQCMIQVRTAALLLHKERLFNKNLFAAEVHPFDLLNLMVHALLAILMLGDLVIVGHPVRMDPDLYCTAGVGLGYSIFSLVYYLADGTDRQLNRAIYPLLDWQKPGKTIVVCCGGIFFVVIMHILVCCCCKVRFLIHKKLFVKKNKKLETCKEHARMLGEQKDFTIPSMLDLK